VNFGYLNSCLETDAPLALTRKLPEPLSSATNLMSSKRDREEGGFVSSNIPRLTWQGNPLIRRCTVLRIIAIDDRTDPTQPPSL
jgi:hypothetical protein